MTFDPWNSDDLTTVLKGYAQVLQGGDRATYATVAAQLGASTDEIAAAEQQLIQLGFLEDQPGPRRLGDKMPRRLTGAGISAALRGITL